VCVWVVGWGGICSICKLLIIEIWLFYDLLN
jgi:hypothetical protein